MGSRQIKLRCGNGEKDLASMPSPFREGSDSQDDGLKIEELEAVRWFMVFEIFYWALSMRLTV